MTEPITREQLMEAARYVDATTGEHEDPEPMLARLGVSMDDLFYVANQRSLRMGLLMDGRDPRKLSRTNFTPVELSAKAKGLVPVFAAVWMDGCVTGLATSASR